MFGFIVSRQFMSSDATSDRERLAALRAVLNPPNLTAYVLVVPE